MPPFITMPAAAPVMATQVSSNAVEPMGAAMTTPAKAGQATARPPRMARRGGMPGMSAWLSAPVTSTRNPEAPTKA